MMVVVDGVDLSYLTTIINMDTISFNNFMGSRLPYGMTAGTRALRFGSAGGAYPPTDWTGLQNASVDDSFVTVPLGFNFYLNGTAYSTAYVGSNTYITFSAGSTAYSGLSGSNPALPKFHLGAADHSYQRVSYFQHPSKWYTIVRFEGNGSTSGTVGSPGIVYEATFFNRDYTRFNSTLLEVRIGNHNNTAGQFGVASASAYLASSSYTANQSYVFNASPDGFYYSVNSANYVQGLV